MSDLASSIASTLPAAFLGMLIALSGCAFANSRRHVDVARGSLDRKLVTTISGRPPFYPFNLTTNMMTSKTTKPRQIIGKIWLLPVFLLLDAVVMPFEIAALFVYDGDCTVALTEYYPDGLKLPVEKTEVSCSQAAKKSEESRAAWLARNDPPHGTSR